MFKVAGPAAKMARRATSLVVLAIGLTLSLGVGASHAQAPGCKAPGLAGKQAKLAIEKCQRLRRVMQPGTENRLRDGAVPEQGGNPRAQPR